jgi:peroxiredoxin
LFQSEYNSQTAAMASVQQFVTEHLAQATVSARMPVALARHVTAHPKCEMNVELYVTTVERLANENRFAAAIKVGREGLKLCASHRDVSRLDEQLKRLQAANPGVPGSVMEFTSPTLAVRRFNLTSMRGKPVLVVFWATWCPGCVKEMPNIKDFYKRYHDDGLEVVGVSLDVDRQKLAEFASENQLAWPQMFSNHPGNEAWDNPIAKHYGVDSIPRAFLLSEDGTIVAAHLRRRHEIENAILKQLSR